MRKVIPIKERAILQKEISSSCPFCDNQDVDHFQIHHIDGNHENNEIGNLLLLCPTCHSKITKGDIRREEVEKIKADLMSQRHNLPKLQHQVAHQINNFNVSAPIENAVLGNGNNITFNVRKIQKSKYPNGCIGFDIQKANYISYLIDQYHKYKEFEVGKESMNYAIFPSNLKRQFKIGKTRTIYHVPITKFEELAKYIQARISNTMLAKINKTKDILTNYRSFEEYITLTK